MTIVIALVIVAIVFFVAGASCERIWKQLRGENLDKNQIAVNLPPPQAQEQMTEEDKKWEHGESQKDWE